MRMRTIAALLASIALSTGLTLGIAFAVLSTAVDVGYDRGRIGIDVAGRYAAEVTPHGAKVGPAAATEDDPYEGNPRMVWACAVHGDRTCGPLR